MNINELAESRVYKALSSKLYGWGASVVILGALFKINHYPGASYLLLIGLSCEAFIFFFSAFEPLLEHYDWSLVYPELAGMGENNEIERSTHENMVTAEDIANKILEKAEIPREVLERLGTGFTKLSQTASAMSEVTEATAATAQYTRNVKAAADSMHVVTESTTAYKELTDTISNNLSAITSGSSSYNSQLGDLNKNLSALNTVYEMQLQGTSDYLKSSKETYAGLDKMLDNLKSTVQNSDKYREEMAKLSNKIEALNEIYGNMLSAMNYNK
ncbi:MAG: gliding motility protein GldL [Bacteroidia bacterium]|nr:gliding motility protein GldL [Bacteroidia bacterium]